LNDGGPRQEGKGEKKREGEAKKTTDTQPNRKKEGIIERRKGRKRESDQHHQSQKNGRSKRETDRLSV